MDGLAADGYATRCRTRQQQDPCLSVRIKSLPTLPMLSSCRVVELVDFPIQTTADIIPTEYTHPRAAHTRSFGLLLSLLLWEIYYFLYFIIHRLVLKAHSKLAYGPSPLVASRTMSN